MKTFKFTTRLIAGFFLFGCSAVLHAQAPAGPPAPSTKAKVVVLNFDSKIPSYDPAAMGNLVRIELEKLDTFNVMDRYDVAYLVEKKELKISNCYGKICLVELGKALEADKMLTGSVEIFGPSIVYTMRLVDIKTEQVERSQVTEFLNQQSEIQTMTSVMLRQLFDKPVDHNVLSQLIKPDSYDARARTPVVEKMNLAGPRMGATFFTGEIADILAAEKSQGGYKAFPVMFQFGYQFEKQYLASGQFQALFEFIPMVTGLDQGLFIPSFTIMNGIRANRYGWEFAFGPTFNLVQKDFGYYDSENNWIRRKDWNQLNANNPNAVVPTYIERMDSRGDYRLGSSFVFGLGKTFRSGNLNVPVNVYAVPGRSGWRFGVSFGYNARNRKK